MVAHQGVLTSPHRGGTDARFGPVSGGAVRCQIGRHSPFVVSVGHAERHADQPRGRSRTPGGAKSRRRSTHGSRDRAASMTAARGRERWSASTSLSAASKPRSTPATSVGRMASRSGCRRSSSSRTARNLAAHRPRSAQTTRTQIARSRVRSGRAQSGIPEGVGPCQRVRAGRVVVVVGRGRVDSDGGGVWLGCRVPHQGSSI